MSWIKDIVNPKLRLWEEFYRNRWQHDKVVRSTHGVNCTGGCSWNIYVKNGIVTWEMQATRLPETRKQPATVRAARVPTGHRVLLVRLQPSADEVSVSARSPDGSLGERSSQTQRSGRGLGIDCGG